MYYIYVIKSQKDDKFYIGQTNNVERRLIRHNKGMVKSTKNRRPFCLVFQEEFGTRKEAINRETYLKSLKGGNEFKKILNKYLYSGMVQR
ncbi:GIY-YIG nuclease family protein [Patescibacteria group bacterium]|nr:GIY-YIG nuclease family protein [Patescibacteria group bacterium]